MELPIPFHHAAVRPASRLPGAFGGQAADAWRLPELAGRIVELSAHGASATLTLAMRLVWEAQREGEPAAWVAPRRRGFHPADAEANGVDLEALAVVRVPEPQDLAKAADYLVRSGAFGVVVLDLADEAKLTDRQLTRLGGLAMKHGTVLLCLTAKPDAAPSLGSLVSLRGPVTRERRGPGRFAATLLARKDKRRAPGWRHEEVWHGPPGLR